MQTLMMKCPYFFFIRVGIHCLVSRMKRVKMRDYDYTSSNFSKITIMLYRMGKKIFINTDKRMKKKKTIFANSHFPIYSENG